MYIPNVDTQNYPFHRLQLVGKTYGTQLNKPTNQNSFKVPKVVRQIIMKTALYNCLD